MIKSTMVAMKNKLWDFLFAGSFKYTWFSYEGKINRTVYSLNVVVVSLIYGLFIISVGDTEQNGLSLIYFYILSALVQKRIADANLKSGGYFGCLFFTFLFYKLSLMFVETNFYYVLFSLMTLCFSLLMVALIFLMFAKNDEKSEKEVYNTELYKRLAVLPVFFIYLFEVPFFRSLYLFIEKLFN